MSKHLSQPLVIENSYIELANPSGKVPGPAPAGRTRLYFDPTLNAVKVSSNGGPFAGVASAGAAGDALTIGADVTLTRTGANALGITESVTLTSPAAASTPLTIAAVTSQSGDLAVISDAVPTNRIRVTPTAALIINGTGTVSAAGINTYGLMVRTNSASETEHIFLRNLETTGSTRIVFVNNSPASGNLLLGGATTTSPSAIVQNKLGLHGGANTGLFLYTQTAGQTIQFYPGGTTVKYTFDTALLTLGDAVDIGINATTGTKIGQSTSKIGHRGATPVTQDTGWGSITNVTPDKAFDANATTTDELADVLGTLIARLVLEGYLGA